MPSCAYASAWSRAHWKCLAAVPSCSSLEPSLSQWYTASPLSGSWVSALAIAFALANALLVSVAYLLAVGVGVWGINQPVAWGFAIP